MPLLRAQKENLVAKLTEELQNSRVALVFAYTGLNMKANDTLRRAAFEAGAKVKMISNNLLGLILKNVNRELEIPARTLALAYGFADEAIAAKTLVEFAKETETLEVLGGWVDGNFFDTAQIKTLAALPTKVALQTQLVGRLGGMISSLAYSLNYPMQKFAYVVVAVRSAHSSTNSKPASGESIEAVEPAVPVAEEKAEEKPNEKTAEPINTPAEEPKEEEKRTPAEEINEAGESKEK